MNLKGKIVKGQEVTLVPYGNQTRYGKEPKKAVITDIRRQYFDVCYFYSDGKMSNFPIQFKISNGEQKSTGFGCGKDWLLYLSEQQILDEQECAELTRKIRNEIGQYGAINLELDKLKEIAKILNIL